MKKVAREAQQSHFVPNYMATSLRDVDFSVLRKAGVKYIALDADSTLVIYRGIKVDTKTRQHLVQQQQFMDGWCIASNRITNDLDDISASIEAPIVPTSLLVRKPQKRYFKRILSYFDAEPHEIAMLGDKLVADVWGANRAGLVTVWVERLGKDGLHDRALRVRTWEQMWIKRYISRHNG